MPRFVALLRGVNVTGRNKVPMGKLREVAEGLGWTDVATYIQSGNLVFGASGQPPALESALERAIAADIGPSVPVLVRSAAAWRRMLGANPFLEAADAEPSRVFVALPKTAPARGAAAALRERATDGERVALAAGTLWLHCPHGIGQSKLTPALLDRLAGSPVTVRNWRTALHLGTMLDDRSR